MRRGTRKNFGGSVEKKYKKHVQKSSRKSVKFRRGSTEPRPSALRRIYARGESRRLEEEEEELRRQSTRRSQSSRRNTPAAIPNHRKVSGPWGPGF
jgi:hypothetical protein